MKKTLLSLFAIAGFSVLASAQIEMYVEGDATDYSGGGVFTFYGDGEMDHHHDVHVENHTGSSQSWVVTRAKINNQDSWSDYMCWGLCYPASSMDQDVWTGPQPLTVADDAEGLLSSHITPSFTDVETVTYRYYVGTELDPYQDSMDMVLIMTPLGIEETTPELSVSIAPNPATNYIKVKAEGVESATIKMYDVLGNVILTKSINGSKTIDVSEFRNGIYFVIIEAKGAKTVNRKVIVRH
jgi:hypothetical protein